MVGVREADEKYFHCQHSFPHKQLKSRLCWSEAHHCSCHKGTAEHRKYRSPSHLTATQELRKAQIKTGQKSHPALFLINFVRCSCSKSQGHPARQLCGSLGCTSPQTSLGSTAMETPPCRLTMDGLSHQGDGSSLHTSKGSKTHSHESNS